MHIENISLTIPLNKGITSIVFTSFYFDILNIPLYRHRIRTINQDTQFVPTQKNLFLYRSKFKINMINLVIVFLKVKSSVYSHFRKYICLSKINCLKMFLKKDLIRISEVSCDCL